MNAKQNHPTASTLLSNELGHRALRTPETDERLLHICPECSSDAVQPHDWIEQPTNWDMTLECPNCGWLESGTYSNTQVERYEDHLESSTQDLTDDLNRLIHANMLTEVDKFAAALAGDLIRPEDF